MEITVAEASVHYDGSEEPITSNASSQAHVDNICCRIIDEYGCWNDADFSFSAPAERRG